MGHAGPSPSLVLIVPFATLLLAIAVLPLVFPHFWENNRNKALVTAALSAPLAYWLVTRDPQALRHSLVEYLSFLCLLGSLFVVTGGIHVSGDMRATPAPMSRSWLLARSCRT